MGRSASAFTTAWATVSPSYTVSRRSSPVSVPLPVGKYSVTFTVRTMSSGLVSSTSAEVYTPLVRPSGSSPFTVSRTA